MTISSMTISISPNAQAINVNALISSEGELLLSVSTQKNCISIEPADIDFYIEALTAIKAQFKDYIPQPVKTEYLEGPAD